MIHLIFVCKYRRSLLIRLSKDVKSIMFEIAEENNFGIKEMEVDKDHIHLLVEYAPWSDGYFACSVGQVSKSVIEQYIRTQG